MGKRKLTEKEIELCKKNLDEMEFKLRLDYYNKKQLELNLDVGIDLTYEQMKKEAKKQLQKVNESIQVSENIIKITNDQIVNGVDEKKEDSAVKYFKEDEAN